MIEESELTPKPHEIFLQSLRLGRGVSTAKPTMLTQIYITNILQRVSDQKPPDKKLPSEFYYKKRY